MKTLANCTPKEFAVQTLKISEKIKKYANGIKKAKEAVEDGERNIFSIISYICGDNIDETMEICGELCFMSGEKFAALDPAKGDEDGIVALTDIVDSQRCISFFTALLKLKKFIDVL